jgi:valyl-tRNA synthetase
MRYTLTSMTTHTQDVRMPVETDPETGRNTSPKFDQGRNFCNKLWNAGRFAMENLSGGRSPDSEKVGFTLADRWILSRLARTVDEVDAALRGYQFAQYAQLLYDFFWRDLCDWYLEAIKPVVRGDDEAGAAARAALAACLDGALRMMHPAVPFVTEQLWAELNRVAPHRGVEGASLPPSDLCIHARWPEVGQTLLDEAAERRFETVRSAIGEIRNIRAQYNIAPRQSVTVRLEAGGEAAAVLEAGRSLIQTLAVADVAAIAPELDRPDDAAVSTAGEIAVIVEGLIDADAERERLTRRKAELEKSRQALAGRLANPGYVEKAPAHLVQQTRDQLAETQKQLDAVEASLNRLQS